MTGSVRIEAGDVVIRVPVAELHTLRVVLAGCPCRATKAADTQALRDRLDKALARVQDKAGVA
jgi:hypothetical protein